MAIESSGDVVYAGGPAGPANTLAIGTVATAPAGSQASATITGASPNQALNLTIPKGDQGLTGPAPWAPLVAWASGLICVASPPATLVAYGGESYVCVASHIAGTFAADLAAGRWTKVAQKGADGAPGTSGAPGANGTNGISVQNGAGAPSNALGSNGDAYLDTTNARLYGAKTGGAWPSGYTSLIGAGALLAANNLSDLASLPAAQANLGIAFAARRQTVLSGPASGGVPTFVPTSSASLTLAFQNLSPATPLLITAAAAFGGVVGDIDLVAQITSNPSLTLAPSATVFGFYDFVSAAVPTPGLKSGTLVPIYQFGGTPSTVNGQFTFDWQAMQGWLGNGTVAVKCNRVYLFEAVTSASAVTTVTPYAYRGFYDSGWTATLPSTGVTRAHNLGVQPLNRRIVIECTTADQGYAVGEQLSTDAGAITATNSDGPLPIPLPTTRLAIRFVPGNGGSTWPAVHGTNGTFVGLTLGGWKYRFVVERGW